MSEFLCGQNSGALRRRPHTRKKPNEVYVPSAYECWIAPHELIDARKLFRVRRSNGITAMERSLSRDYPVFQATVRELLAVSLTKAELL